MNNIDTVLIAIITVLSIAFFVRLVFKALFLIWLFQLKEYRFDRLFANFRETKEGKRFFISKRELALWLLFFMPFFYQFSFITYPYFILVIIVFSIESKDLFEAFRQKQLRRPVFTGKAILLSVFSIFTIIFLILPSVSTIPLVFVDRFLILIVAFFVFAISIPTDIVKKVFIFLASRRILGLKKLIVVGITGSYGKSLTKELLADFLSLKFNVLKTPRSVNTDLAIARLILKELNDKHDIFVVEMGAYKRGEIKSICDMVKPRIGVLTGINEQHLSLFGSLNNTKKAKFELIDSLPQDGMAFFNGDDTVLLETIKTSQVLRTQPARSTVVYSAKQLPASITAKKNPFLSNIAAAYFLAQKLGVDEEKLKQKMVRTIDTLGIKTVKKDNVTILDDTFNTNPNGFHAALDVLALFKTKKVLVTPGIIELGSESYRIHKELGERMGQICDTIILTTDNFEEPIREGLTEAKFDMGNFLIPRREELISVVKSLLKEKTVLLLEGRMPSELDFLK